MRLVLSGRNVDITPSLRRIVDRKMAKLSRVLNDGLISAQIVLTVEKYRRIAEITTHARGDHIFHGLGHAPAWQTAVGEAVSKIATQARKLKGKWERRKRHATGKRIMRRSAAAVAVPVTVPQTSPSRPLVRLARYRIRPMTLDEALNHVDGGGDELLVFRNVSTDAISVIYRRKDGHLVLLEGDA